MRTACVCSLLVFIVATCSTPIVVAQKKPIQPEYKIKVAYLFNFTRYVQWPNSALIPKDAPFRIGVIGPNPFGAALDHVAKKKKAQGRPILVEQFATVDDYRPCHMVFVSKHISAAEHAQFLQMTASEAVLVVCESKGMARRGAAVNFFLDVDKTIGFEINIDVAQRNSLRIKAQLLKLAKVVRDEKTRGN